MTVLVVLVVAVVMVAMTLVMDVRVRCRGGEGRGAQRGREDQKPQAQTPCRAGDAQREAPGVA